MGATLVTVLASGGLDSTACITYYQSQGFQVDALWVDYGQCTAIAEETAVDAVVSHYGVPIRKLCVRGVTWPQLGSDLFEFRGRNLTLVSLALNTARGHGGLIALGIHTGTPFADCSPEFSQQLTTLVGALSYGRLRLDCPFLDWNKGQVAVYAARQAVPFNLTYSCERGSQRPCGECVKCRDMAEVIEIFNSRFESDDV